DTVYDGVGRTTFDASLACLRPRGGLALFGGASGQVPPFDPQRLNSGGSLFLTRPTLGHHVATRSELEQRAGAVLDAVAGASLHVRRGARSAMPVPADAHCAPGGGAETGKVLLVP